MSAPPHPTLRILCLGDSLTAGYSCYGMVLSPYSTTFKESLVQLLDNEDYREKNKGRGPSIEVVTDGKSGDLVSAAGTFEERMRSRIEGKDKDERTRKPLYDWVLFLGGTNDLGYGKPPSVIYEAIVKVTDLPLAKGSKILLFTVPECGAVSASLDAKRNKLNEFIKNDTRENVYTFDLWEKIKYHDMPVEERDSIWDDGLHFTELGYEKMGMMVAERLGEILDAETKGEVAKE